MIALILSAALAGPVPIVPAGQTFRCTPVAIYDTDGPIWCAEGPRLRLNAGAGREADGTCRRGHPCPAMMPGPARQQTLRAIGGIPSGRSSQGHVLLRGSPTMTCTSSGRAVGQRTGAICNVGRQQLNCLVIRSGAMAYWPRYDHGGAVRQSMARQCSAVRVR